MNVQSQNIPTMKTARYYLSATPGYLVKTIWFVLHGYGQLAENFIKLFARLADDNNLIVAPEALNKFYLRGYSGEVGANWMTKNNRENEIKDYLIFLNNVFQKVNSEIYSPKVRLNVIGFSQGGAVAARWLLTKKVFADNLFLCGSKLPRDIDAKVTSIIFKATKLFYVIGREDEFISKQDIEEEELFLANNRIDANFIRHDFGHELNDKIIELIKSQIK